MLKVQVTQVIGIANFDFVLDVVKGRIPIYCAVIEIGRLKRGYLMSPFDDTCCLAVARVIYFLDVVD